MKLIQKFSNLSVRSYLVLTLCLLILFAVILLAMGQIPICKCGYIKFWHGVTFSSENSQHITDWYTFSHIIHGFGFYFLFWLIGRKFNWPIGLMFLAAVFLEISWEIFENTDLVINRYREVTISLDYYGDSVINSVADVLAMMFGFFIAAKYPIWITTILLILMEIVVGFFIRDNLTLNIIMLVWPNDTIRNWQSGG